MRNKNFVCLKCNKVFISEKVCKSRRPKYCSRICYGLSLRSGRKLSDKQKQGLQVSRYRMKEGARVDSGGYSAVHNWLKKFLKKPKACDKCGSCGNVQWANTSGEYLREASDWRSLCRPCHWAFDKTNPKKPELVFQAKRINGKVYYGKRINNPVGDRA